MDYTITETFNTVTRQLRHNPQRAEKKVRQLKQILGYLFRASSRGQVMLGDEIRFLAAYLELASYCFGKRLKYQIQAPLIFHGTPMPAMLIAPLVENAIRHGIAPRGGNGEIVITISWKKGYLRIGVTDDGLGFDPNFIVGAKGDAARRPSRDVVTGLVKVRERVERISGPGHWWLTSSPYLGTIIVFEIPYGVGAER
jgi:two-component system LytT family sensor kinase